MGVGGGGAGGGSRIDWRGGGERGEGGVLTERESRKGMTERGDEARAGRGRGQIHMEFITHCQACMLAGLVLVFVPEPASVYPVC